MKTLLINGYFLCRTLTGIERYAHEITMRLDALCRPGEIAIIVPGDLENIPPYKNITIIRHKKKIQNILWQMVTLQLFLLTHRCYMVLEFGNTCLPFAPGIVFLHDIYCEFFTEDFSTFRDKIIRLYNRWQYRLVAKKAKKIVTVSYFTRNQVAASCHISPEKITVVYSSWNHFRTIIPDYTIFTKYPLLTDRKFYFSLGSLSKRKNSKWIIEYAKQRPDTLFALSGTSLPTTRTRDLDNDAQPANIMLLGYLDDGKVKALMEKCRAFILPSYYEGFGLTPLEALSCGAKIIVAKAASLPEIYGDTAHYIDPFDTSVDLDALLAEPVESPAAILEKYSYDTAASLVYDIIQDITRSNVQRNCASIDIH
jgi:glycosyltransferase involved in cell wall biosynthesis